MTKMFECPECGNVFDPDIVETDSDDDLCPQCGYEFIWDDGDEDMDLDDDFLY